jgi:hypothetical protein
MRCAALNTGPDFHLLDHIAPLSNLMKMPLLVTEEKNFELACRYYPDVDAKLFPDLEYRLSDLAANYDALFECKYWQPHLKQLFRDLFRKDMRLVFCPHGQSDKGYAAPLLSPYAMQDLVLLYGDLLKEMLKDLQIEARAATVGNFRLSYYLQNQSFYDALAEKEIFSRLPKNKKTLLYAPTWRDADSASSFFESAPPIFDLPSDWNLIVKLHPLLEQRDPARFYRISAMAENKPNVLLVSEFPPVYPLLSRVDAYLGDYSSVGYDFLYFQKPMFFLLNSNLPRGRIHSCGIVLETAKDLLLKLEGQMNFAPQQKSLYIHAFGEISIDARVEILCALNRLAEGERKAHPSH